MITATGQKSSALSTRAYDWAQRAGLLERSWFRGIFVTAYFLHKRFYEDPFWSLIHERPELFRGGDVLDIGANIGYTASLFARVVSRGAKVYAFEPDRRAFQMLLEVVRRKNLGAAIEAIHSAVGAEVGSVEFWHNQSHSADHKVVTLAFKASGPAPGCIESTPLTSVDAFVGLRQLQRIAFIKVDVQGYELAVCQGSEETLQRFPDATLCVEYSPESLRDLGFEPRELLHFLRSRGYHIYLLTPGKLALAHNDAEIESFTASAGYVDLLCSRKLLPGFGLPKVSQLPR